MNMMHTLRRWCLLLAAMATVAFAAPGFAKNFRAELVDAAGQPTVAVPNGTDITIRLKVYNTSTEPATVNSIVLCNVPGVTLTGTVPMTGSGALETYVPSGNDPNVCGPAGGKTLTNFTGIRRNTTKTFQLYATVSATCSSATAWPIFASTGNTFSSVDKFTQDKPLQAAFGCDIVLGCAGTYTEPPGAGPNDPSVTIQRFPDKNDGTTCVPTGFNVTFISQRQVQVVWDEGNFPNVVLKTTVTWPKELTEQTTSFPKRTQVAWAETSPGNPNFIAAPACISAAAPTAWTTSNPSPFPLLDASHPTYPNVIAKACLISEEFVVQAPATLNCPSPTSLSVGCVMVDSVFWLRGDPWLSRQ